MKKILFVLAFMSILFSCSSSNDDDNGHVTLSRVTKTQLESGTGTFELTSSSKIYYLSFKGNLMHFSYDGVKVDNLITDDYSIDGDSMTIGNSKVYIQMVDWGAGNTGTTNKGQVQLLIRGNMPYGMKEGYYDTSTYNPRNI